MAATYIPPKQGIAGQLFDVGFLLALVFATLFLPIWLGIAVPSRVEKLPTGVTYTVAYDRSALIQHAVEYFLHGWRNAALLGQ